jgi:glycosyltransferase involved in cell wall biosynthesis
MAKTNISAAWMLSASPPLILTGHTPGDLIGIAPEFGGRFGNIDAGFIVYPTWSIGSQELAEKIRARYLRHAEEYPRHLVQFICNTAEETRLLQRQGLPASLLNRNFAVSDDAFHPVPGTPIKFDAIYNARFVPIKRQELTSLVPSVAHVTFVEGGRPDREAQFAEIYRKTILEQPNHVLLNRLDNGLPVRMSHAEINAHIASASVGLILSPVEGANYASMEYLFAGLPVVSTPSIGGRDLYFDDDYCLICDPTPEAVRDAVAELKSRNLSREEVRARTLAKIAPERLRLLAMADQMLIELGSQPAFAGKDWPFRHLSSVTWAPNAAHLDEFAAASGLADSATT